MILLILTCTFLTSHHSLAFQSKPLPPPSTDSLTPNCSCSTFDAPPTPPTPATPSRADHLAGSGRYKIVCTKLTALRTLSDFCARKYDFDSLHVENVQTDSGSFLEVVSRLSISRLKLTNSIVVSLNDSTLPCLEHVTLLDLSQGRVSSLKFVLELLRGIGSGLDLFDFSGNRVSDVDGYFDNMLNLAKLYARSNRITSVNETTFAKLINLRYLNLESNRISRIDRKSFQALRRLSYLILTKNPLHHLDEVQLPSRFFSFLDLTECHLTHLPMANLSSLRYLQLRNNRIQHLYDMDGMISDLAILVLDKNFLVGSSPDFFSRLKKLRQLWLNDNNLQILPSNLPVNLQKLFLDGNLIESLSKNNFPHRSELVTLSLSGNRITKCEDEAFNRLLKLEYLDLSSNKIMSLRRDCFSGLESLRTLHLSSNPLHKMDTGLFIGMAKLKSLTMSNVAQNPDLIGRDLFENLNNLEFLDIEGSPSFINKLLRSVLLSRNTKLLQVLNVANSELKTVSAEDLIKLKSIENVKISSNSWTCNSSIHDFKVWLMTERGRFSPANRNINRCSMPVRLEDRLIISLSNSDTEDTNRATGLKRQESTDDLNYRPLIGTVTQTDNDNYDKVHQIDPDGRDQETLVGTKKDMKIRVVGHKSNDEEIFSEVQDLEDQSHTEVASSEVDFIVAVLVTSTVVVCILTVFVLGLQVALNKRSTESSILADKWFEGKEEALPPANGERSQKLSNWETVCDSPTGSSWRKYKWDEL